MALLAPFSIVGYTMLLCLFAPGRAELALFAALSAVTATAYLCGLAGLLEPAAVVLFWGGVVLFVAMPFALRRKRGGLGDLLVPGVVLFVVFSIVQWLLFRETEYFFWDEFSHWGLAAKEMFHAGRLHESGGNVQFPYYPPATSVWHYVVARCAGYSEPTVLFAQFLLLLAPTMVLYRRTTWRKPQWIAAVVALQLFLFANLGHGTTSLYVDHILAVFLGGIVVAHLAHERSTRTLVLLAPPLFCLVLVKEVGVFLAAMAALWILIEQLTVMGRPRATGSRREWLRGAAMAMVLIAPLAAHASWKQYVERHAAVESSAAETPTLAAVAGALVGSPGGYRDTVKSRFGEVLLRQQISKSKVSQEFNEFSYAIRDRYPSRFRLSAVGFFLLATFFIALRAWWADHERASLWRLAGFQVLLFALYTVMLFALYAFIFTENKGVQLASYVRYMNVVMLPIVMIALALYLPLGGRFGWVQARKRVGMWGLPVCLLVLFILETPHLEPLFAERPRLSVRTQVAQRIRQARERVPPGASLYVVSLVRDNGFMQTLLRYELSPLRVSFGNPTSDAAMQREASRHDYLLVFALDPKAVSRLGGVFASGHTLFKVEQRDGRVVLLPPR